MELALDTNDVLDATTITNLNTAASATPLVRSSVVGMRRRRAREALALAWLFHKMRATTFSLRYEVEELLRKKAPPTSSEGLHPTITRLDCGDLAFGELTVTPAELHAALTCVENDLRAFVVTLSRLGRRRCANGCKPVRRGVRARDEHLCLE